MLLSYGMSIAGSVHVAKDSPCQDSHCCRILSNGWIVAAIADGVGSAKHSEIASKMACDVLIETCEEQITEDIKFSEAKNIIAEAYKRADLRIKEYVGQSGDLITDYDTTLSAVIYDGKRLAYGHSGDGGIVALTYDGDYVKITEPQKAEDGICVVPLRAGEKHWKFGECEIETASVLLATDGMYDSFTPYLLKGQPVELYIPLIRWFMDNNVIGITQENRQEIEESRRCFICGDRCKSITDDKTILVVFNQDVMPKQKEDSYYAEPDWVKLQEIWNQMAYPHLYKDKQDNLSEKTDAPEAGAEFENHQFQETESCSNETASNIHEAENKNEAGLLSILSKACKQLFQKP